MIRKYAEIFCWKKLWVAFAATHIFSAKNIRILYIESAKTVNDITPNELVKLMMLWTTGPWFIPISSVPIWSTILPIFSHLVCYFVNFFPFGLLFCHFFPILSTHTFPFHLLVYFHTYEAYSSSVWWYKCILYILYGKPGNQAKQSV